MKYKEKLQLIEDHSSNVNKGMSFKEIEKELADEGFYKLDIDKVLFGVKKNIRDKLGQLVKEMIIENEFIPNKGEFGSLHEDIINYIKEKEIEGLISADKGKIRSLLLKGVLPDDIKNEIKSHYFSEDKVLGYAHRTKRKIEEEHYEESAASQLQNSRGPIYWGLMFLAALVVAFFRYCN